MRKVHRHTFLVQSGSQQVELPVNSKVVHVGSKHQNFIDIWFEFEAQTLFKTVRAFQVFGTDHEIPADAQHVGSVIQGSMVFHLYERFLND